MRTYNMLDLIRFHRFAKGKDDSKPLELIKEYDKAHPPKSAKEKMENFNASMIEFEIEIVKMSDRELYFLVYNEDGYEETDFSYQELKSRGIEEFRPCDRCQGAGCPNCSGQGRIPTFE